MLIITVFYCKFLCVNRCPSYPPVSSTCVMQADPKDPICCKVPYCDGVAVPGTISGGSVIPTPAPSLTPTSTPSYCSQSCKAGNPPMHARHLPVQRVREYYRRQYKVPKKPIHDVLEKCFVGSPDSGSCSA